MKHRDLVEENLRLSIKIAMDRYVRAKIVLDEVNNYSPDGSSPQDDILGAEQAEEEFRAAQRQLTTAEARFSEFVTSKRVPADLEYQS